MYLTVGESMMIATHLKLGYNISMEEKNSLVRFNKIILIKLVYLKNKPDFKIIKHKKQTNLVLFFFLFLESKN